jgi:GAF domain-containing protein/HAMP domain-containing protein
MSERITPLSQITTDERDAFRRRAAIRITLVAGLLLLAVSVPSLITLKPEPSLNYVGNIITAVMGAVSLISAWLSYRSTTARGSLLFITGILLLALGAPFYAHGVGLQTGMIVAIIVATIAATTLPPQMAARATIAGIIVTVIVILLDLYLPDVGLGTYESPNATYFLIVILFVFGFFIFRQLNSYTLRTKLILFFVTIAGFSVGAAAMVTNTISRNAITQQVGAAQETLAERLAFETGKELEAQIENLQAASTQFEEIAQAASDSYTASEEQILAEIIHRDNAWRDANDQSALVRGVINNDAAAELREFQAAFPDHVELFITDRYGANIAATNRTSDYYQADENWWKLAYRLGRGAIYISQPEYDESSDTYAVLMALPILAEGEIVGILRSTYNVSAILANLQQSTASRFTDIDLRIQGNILLNGDPLTNQEAEGLRDIVRSRYGQINYRGESSLVSEKRVFSSTNTSARQAVDELGWSVIVHEDVDDALLPVRQQTRAITLIALSITLLVGLLGLVASQRLAAPITNLTEITGKIAEGDLAIRAEISTQDEIGYLANSFNRMTSRLQDTLGGLERRVAERTADLELARLLSERRAQELQSISDISRIISTEQRLEILLPLVTRTVSERFDFYHVGIFFVDPTRQFAVLQASNSEGGKRMLERSHRLNVGTGIVGTVGQTGKPRIALDVGTDAIFFDNPDLPDTRSEMALPLNFRGQTIGILDVQSTKPGAFTETDASTLGILADQVAIAIENARLFGQTQEARDEAETLYNQFLRTEWKAFLQQESSIGYRQSVIGGKPLKKAVDSDEISEALSEGRVVVINGEDSKSLPTLAVPVQLRGQTIGVLNIKSPVKNRRWNQDEINLAQAISNRLALALDNARLLQESQRRAAREAKIGEVTSKIGASINMRNVLQTAVEELGRALPGSEVIIQFESNGT